MYLRKNKLELEEKSQDIQDIRCCLNLILEMLIFTESSSFICRSQRIQSDLELQEQKLNLILGTLLFTESSSFIYQQQLEDLVRLRTSGAEAKPDMGTLLFTDSSSYIWNSQKFQSDLGLQEQQLNLIQGTLLFTDSSSYIWSSQKIKSDLELQEQKQNLILGTLILTNSSPRIH